MNKSSEIVIKTDQHGTEVEWCRTEMMWYIEDLSLKSETEKQAM